MWDLQQAGSVDLPLLNLAELDQASWKRLNMRKSPSVVLGQDPVHLLREDVTFHSSCSIRRTSRPSSVCSFSFSRARTARSSQTPTLSLNPKDQLELSCLLPVLVGFTNTETASSASSTKKKFDWNIRATCFNVRDASTGTPQVLLSRLTH